MLSFLLCKFIIQLLHLHLTDVLIQYILQMRNTAAKHSSQEDIIAVFTVICNPNMKLSNRALKILSSVNAYCSILLIT